MILLPGRGDQMLARAYTQNFYPHKIPLFSAGFTVSSGNRICLGEITIRLCGRSEQDEARGITGYTRSAMIL